MSTSDYLTLSVSGLALVVSILSAVIGTRLQRKQMRATVREQLTSVVQDLIAAQAELDLALLQGGGKREAESATINHRLTALARQACELDKMDQTVGFDVEFIAIANALRTSGDDALAESYFAKALERSPSDYYRAVNGRLFARFLFDQGRYESGRERYKMAASVLENSTDTNRAANSRTFQEWLGSETANFPAQSTFADECRANAENLLKAIRHPGMRQAELALFERMWKAPSDLLMTRQLPVARDAVAPDGSDVRLLLGLQGGSMAHFELGTGRTSKAVAHRTVEEIWYVVSGAGEMWRRLSGHSVIVDLHPGVCITIPLGTEFQFRCIGDKPLAAIGVTMPPWPGDGEAYFVEGPWQSTEI